MESSFDLGRLLKNTKKTHKGKPLQFISVASGVTKRLDSNIKYRKSTRLTTFDNIRDLSECVSPVAVSTHQTKVEHRRQQLEKWKEQKEKQKKEAAAAKKKPFVAGVAHAPIKFVPPPPVQKPKPSTSGRVTRSQTSKPTSQHKEPKVSNTAKSFAPINASFRPPDMKNVPMLPKLGAANTKKDKKQSITFNPIVHNTQKEKQLSKTVIPMALDTKPARKQTERTKKARKVTKPSPIKNKNVKLAFQVKSSSSSEMEEQTVKVSQPRLQCKPIDNKPIRKQAEGSKKARKVTKPSPTSNKNKVIQSAVQSSSSEIDDQPVKKSPIRTRNGSRISLANQNLPTSDSKLNPTNPEIFTPNKPVPKSESSSEERLRSPKSFDSVEMTPEQVREEAKKISPCVTISRGKENARKEFKKKLNEGLLDEDASDIDSVDHFRKQLASEIKRMTAMCETWDKISQQEILPESVQEAVLSAVGQARLLMSQKLAQFAALVEACAHPQPGLALVTPADLHGFWDMVFMQVENVDVRFKSLEEMRSRGWVEQEAIQVKRKVVKVPPKKVTKPSKGPSQLRDMIAAARKAKKEQQESSVTVTAQENGGNKTFEAGFFTVQSPVKSPVLVSPGQGTPKTKNTLLKAVLSNEAKKSASKSASFAMLRASVMGKCVEYEGIAPIPQTPVTPVNLYATPGRSILKNTNTDNKSTRKSTKSARKSIKVVLFNHSDIESLESSYRTPESESNLLNDDKTDNYTMENKENTQRSKLVRQDAMDGTPMETRSRRKSNTNDILTPRRSLRQKILQETDENMEEKTQRSCRRRKSTRTK